MFVRVGLTYFPLPNLVEFGLLRETVNSLNDARQAGVALLGVVILGAPWLAGLALRFSDRAAASRVSQLAAQEESARATREAEQSREIAQLRDDQARLARDVHDVVGHSLAVILAQAESAQYLEDADTSKLKQTMQHIASSARSSLQDVRHVLTLTPADQARPGSLDALVSGVRESGHELVSSEVGAPQPLPPELDGVSHRVLQEMLTNAIEHGRRGEPVYVERHWEGELRIEVRNMIGPDVDGPTPAKGSRGCADGSSRSAGGSTYAAGRTRRRDGHGDGLAADAGAVTGMTVTADPIRVLLVDDLELFREGVRVIIDAQEGMTVVGSAGDGNEAIRIVDDLAPDVVLMDVRMPELDGVEATRRIFAPDRLSRRQRPVRVIVLTTFNLDDRAASAIRHGASGFLLKDTTPAQLRDAIRTVHAGNAVLAPADLSTLLEGQFRARTPAPAAYLSLTEKEQAVLPPFRAASPTSRSRGRSSPASPR